MWKKEDAKPQGVSSSPANTTSVAPASTPAPSAPAATTAPVPVSTSGRTPASISHGIKIKGEVTGSEDLFVDGLVDGKLSLTNGSLTIGPNGTVKADVSAREVIVRGRVEGKVTGRDKVQLASTGEIIGEVQTDRLAIEEGATLRGKIEAGKQAGRVTESKAVAASSSNKGAEASASSKNAEYFSSKSGSAAD